MSVPVALNSEGWEECAAGRPPVSIVTHIDTWQINRLPYNYHNILGPAYVDTQNCLKNCPDAEQLVLELGERAATQLVIDTQMFKSQLQLWQQDGWWVNSNE